jgi:hypothetical protein
MAPRPLSLALNSNVMAFLVPSSRGVVVGNDAGG